MKFNRYILEEEKVLSFKYTARIKNMKDLTKYLSAWQNSSYMFDNHTSKKTDIYDAQIDKMIGVIRDQGKEFLVSNGSKMSEIVNYIKQGV